MADGVQKHLEPNQFNDIIRTILIGTADNATFVRHATFRRLKQLRVKRDAGKAITKTPAGSDQNSPGGIVRWMERIQPGDAKAIEQLVAIDATAVSRTS